MEGLDGIPHVPVEAVESTSIVAWTWTGRRHHLVSTIARFVSTLVLIADGKKHRKIAKQDCARSMTGPR